MAKPTSVRGLQAETPMVEAARALVGARLGDVQRHLAGLGEPPVERAVHDSRVATRRLRGALVLFGDGRAVRRADAEVRRLQDALGQVRDTHVQLVAFGDAAERALPLERTALRHVRQALEADLPAQLAALATARTRWAERGLAAVTRLEGRSPKGKLGGHRLRDRLVGQLEVLESRLIDALEDDAAPPMHQLRIAVKRFRYGIELLAPAMPEETDEIARQLVPMQETLGTLHDTDVRLALVEAHGGGHGAGTDGVRRRLRADRERQAAAVRRALESWEEEAVALRAQVLLTSSRLKRAAPGRRAGRR